jgi:hypothetical protein
MKQQSAKRFVGWTAICCALACLALAGCGGDGDAGDAPTVYQATGTVKNAQGQPLSGGSVVLRRPAGAGLNVNGRIGTDGSFSLQTITGGGSVVTGAPPGTYLVTIVPDLSQDQTTVSGAMPIPIELPGQVEIKQGEDNVLTLVTP